MMKRRTERKCPRLVVDAKTLGFLLLSTTVVSVVQSFSFGSTSLSPLSAVKVPRGSAAYSRRAGRKQHTLVFALQRDDVMSDIDFEADALEQMKEYEEFARGDGRPDGGDDQDGAIITSFDPFRLQHGGKVTDDTSAEDLVRRSSSNAEADEVEGANMGDVWRARLLLVVAAALYGTNFTCVKCLNESVPVGISTTLRFALAALATLPWLLGPTTTTAKQHGGEQDEVSTEFSKAEEESKGAEGRSLNGSFWDGLQSSTSLAAAFAGFEVGLCNSIGYVAQAVGLETTDASKSAFICSLAVVIVPILDHFAGKKILPREIVGCIMAVAGVGFLELGGDEAVHSLSSGDIASLVQPIAFGLGFWRMEAGMHRFPEEAKRMTAAQIFAVFLASASYGVFMSGETWSVSQITEWVTDPMILAALFWTGCITTALTVYMETLALKTLSAAETTMIFSTEPLWGAAFASVVVEEHLGMGAGIGAALILGGCLFSNMGSLDWLGGSPSNDEDGVPPPQKDGGANILPKALLGPGLSVATPAVAIAALSAELSNDSSASTMTETIRDKLGEI